MGQHNNVLIFVGWRMAAKVAKDALTQSARTNGENADKFRNDLFNIARTTLSSKILKQERDFFSQMCVDAVMRIKVPNQKILPLQDNQLRQHPHHQKSWRFFKRFLLG